MTTKPWLILLRFFCYSNEASGAVLAQSAIRRLLIGQMRYEYLAEQVSIRYSFTENKDDEYRNGE